jgi:SAM domain (Sterile alpha motif)
MQQIADRLKELGMSEYARRFAENGIDLSVLPDLTDQDFKEMGVLLGHRRKLLRPIAELNDTPAAAASPSPATHVQASLSQSTWLIFAALATGKLVEHWGLPDRFALLHQIGALPPPPK